MGRRIDVEVKAGIFVFISIFLFIGMIFTMGGSEMFLTSYRNVFVKFKDVKGLTAGAKVLASGIKIGRVKDIEFNENYKDVTVHMLVEEKFAKRVRIDSIVKISTLGVLGDKFVEIVDGTPEAAEVQDGGTLIAEYGGGLDEIFAKGNDIATHLKETLINVRKITHQMVAEDTSKKLMSNLLETSNNLRRISGELQIAKLNHTFENLEKITSGIQSGEGTVGALLKDPSLYDDIKNLVDGANRSSVLKYVVRHAVKKNDDAKKDSSEPAEETARAINSTK